MPLDWSKLIAVKGDKRYAFAHLCCLLARRLEADQGEIISTDDTGGGDGVEFYQVLPDGSERGWQAKFFYPHPRLREGSRKRQVKESLLRALQVHHKLSEWTLCTPYDLTREEREWLEGLGPSLGPRVKLTHWGFEEISSMLADPRAVGIGHYLFGSFELSPAWFSARLEPQIEILRDKFIPEVHTETPLDAELHAVAGDEIFQARLQVISQAFSDAAKASATALERVNRTAFSETWSGATLAVKQRAASIQTLTGQLTRTMNEALCQLHLGGETRELLNESRRIAGCLIDEFRHCEGDIHNNLPGDISTEVPWDRNTDYEHFRHVLFAVPSPFLDLESYFRELHETTTTYDARRLTALGVAGSGKSQTLAMFCEHRISQAKPALLFLGLRFSDGATLEVQAHDLLGLPSSLSWDDFVWALEEYAVVSGDRVPIVIDALNESESPELWRRHLKAFETRVERTQRLALVLSCRDTYSERIWEKVPPPNIVTVYGFDFENVDEAVVKYFNYFRIQADTSFVSLSVFKLPLYLRLFCETKNPGRHDDIEVQIGQSTIFEVFDEFIGQVESRVSRAMDLAPGISSVKDGLARLALELWKTNSRSLALPHVMRILDGCDPQTPGWSERLSGRLLAEGLLLSRDWDGMIRDQTVSFTYDLLGSYLIAKCILEDVLDLSPDEIALSSSIVRLSSENYESMHPLRHDILRCTAALAPSVLRTHFCHLRGNAVLFSCGVEALFEVSPRHITGTEVALVEELFNIESNRTYFFEKLLEVALLTDHPFNSDFLDTQLRKMSLVDRDLSWSEHVRRNAFRIRSFIRSVQQGTVANSAVSDLRSSRMKLAIACLGWFLTTTDHQTRDIASKGLVAVGVADNSSLFEWTIRSLEINDPYVSERSLGACYGTSLTVISSDYGPDFLGGPLAVLALALYELIFAVDAPHYSTHAIARDYSASIIHLATAFDPGLFSSKQMRAAAHPFRGCNPNSWGESDDRDQDKYSEGDAPFHSDFDNYVLGGLVSGRLAHDYDSSLYRKTRRRSRWRVYDLGYTLEAFSQIDQKIVRGGSHFGRNDSIRVDRYGKKYSWISYFELFGCYSDAELLRHYYVTKRPFGECVDISFPDEPDDTKVFSETSLNEEANSLAAWVSAASPLDWSENIALSLSDETSDNWLLLYGSVQQTNENLRREVNSHMFSMMCDSAVANRIEELLTTQPVQFPFGFRDMPDVSGFYVGEFPWHEHITDGRDGALDIEYGSRNKVSMSEEVDIFSRGRKLSDAEATELLSEVTTIRDDKEKLESFITTNQIKVKRRKVRHRFQVPNELSFRVQNTTIQLNVDSQKSVATPGRGAPFVSKRIAQELGLRMGLPSWNLYDSIGMQATAAFRVDEYPSHSAEALFLRQDLCDRFLAASGLELLWIVTSSREMRLGTDYLGGRRPPDWVNPVTTRSVYRYGRGKVHYRGTMPTMQRMNLQAAP